MENTTLTTAGKKNGNACSRIGSKLMKFGEWISKSSAFITVAIIGCMMLGSMVFADGDVDADSMWTTLMTEIKKWVTRLGGLIMIVGGIMFALGWKQEDADGKSRGLSTMIAGALVMVVVTFVDSFITAD